MEWFLASGSSSADFLRSVSDSKGQVGDLSALKGGFLDDAAFRKTVTDKLSGVALEDASVGKMIEVYHSALMSAIQEVDVKAVELAKRLEGKTSAAALKPELPNEEACSEVMKDWLLWNVIGNKVCPDRIGDVPSALLAKRLAYVALSAKSPVGQAAFQVHLISELKEYVDFELKTRSSKTPLTRITVCSAFKRLLGDSFPHGIASEVAEEVADQWQSTGNNAFDIVVPIFEARVKQYTSEILPKLVLPAFEAPQDKKAKKDKKGGDKENKGEKGNKADKGEKKQPAKADNKGEQPAKAEKGAKKGGEAAAAKPTGICGVLEHEELGWAVLSYVTQGGEGVAAPAAAPAAAPTAKVEAPKTKMELAKSWAPGIRVSEFGLIFAPIVPPGHTAYTWSKHEPVCPIGHTAYSWTRGRTLNAAGKTAQSNKKAQKEAKKVDVKKDSKADAKKEAKPAKAAPADEPLLTKLDLRVGQIISVDNVPDSDNLYVLKVNIGSEERQVLSGLVKWYTKDQLVNRKVVVYCNIKPGKMRGMDSQAMILAACAIDGDQEVGCELLESDAEVGSTLMCGDIAVGANSATVSVKNISKTWKSVTEDLLCDATGVATWKNTPLTVNGKPIMSKSLKSVIIK